ncbi:hypothetical protein J4225_03595 [Candidatus Pacearchaeota archaeon]|nr:hypothetical protein [Candidatus Pacearchaeota archaeon]
MKNLYKSVKSLGRGLLLVGGLTGLAVLTTSCDENKDTLLYETTYQGPVTVRAIREVQGGKYDNFRLDVVDKDGQLITSVTDVEGPYKVMIKEDETKQSKVYSINNKWNSGGIDLGKRSN